MSPPPSPRASPRPAYIPLLRHPLSLRFTYMWLSLAAYLFDKEKERKRNTERKSSKARTSPSTLFSSSPSRCACRCLSQLSCPYFTSKDLSAEIDHALQTLRINGTFNDVNYTDYNGRSWWETAIHLQVSASVLLSASQPQRVSPRSPFARRRSIRVLYTYVSVPVLLLFSFLCFFFSIPPVRGFLFALFSFTLLSVLSIYNLHALGLYRALIAYDAPRGCHPSFSGRLRHFPDFFLVWP